MLEATNSSSLPPLSFRSNLNRVIVLTGLLKLTKAVIVDQIGISNTNLIPAGSSVTS